MANKILEFTDGKKSIAGVLATAIGLGMGVEVTEDNIVVVLEHVEQIIVSAGIVLAFFGRVFTNGKAFF